MEKNDISVRYTKCPWRKRTKSLSPTQMLPKLKEGMVEAQRLQQKNGRLRKEIGGIILIFHSTNLRRYRNR